MVWYFAYGSNMTLSVLSKRRKVFPAKAGVVATCDKYVGFRMWGIPFFEPSFASLNSTPCLPGQPKCHGVAFYITKQEYQMIKESEGGNGTQ